MPYVRIETNQEVRNEKEFCLQVSKTIAQISGKPENFIMVSLSMSKMMIFAGKYDPCIFIDYRSVDLNSEDIPDLSNELTEFFIRELSVPPTRIYINFTNVEPDHWGYDGSTF